MDAMEILAAMRELLARVDGEAGMSEEQQAEYESLERSLARVNATAEARARQVAYETVVTPLVQLGEDRGEARAWDRLLRSGDAAEYRALSEGVGSEGGFLVPTMYRDKVVECIRSYGGVAMLAEEITTTDGAPLEWLTMDDGDAIVQAAKATITPENAEFTAGGDFTFGKDALGAYKYTSTGPNSDPLRVSVELLQDARIDLESLITRRFGERIARKQALHWVNGNGVGQPEGILTGTANVSLTTSNDLSNAANGYNKLLDIENSIDSAYLANASWLMSRAAWTQIRKIVDGNGRPLIDAFSNASLADGSRGTLLGYPVHIEESFPLAANGTNFLAFGDIRQAYVIRRVADLTVVRDPYTRMEFGQVQFVAWERADGMVQDRCAYSIVAGV